MKQYLLFAGKNFDPHGGFEDYQGSYDSVDEIELLFDIKSITEGWDWYHVVEHATMELVASGTKEEYL